MNATRTIHSLNPHSSHQGGKAALQQNDNTSHHTRGLNRMQYSVSRPQGLEEAAGRDLRGQDEGEWKGGVQGRKVSESWGIEA